MRSLTQFSEYSNHSNHHNPLRQISYCPDLDVTFGCCEKKAEFTLIGWSDLGVCKHLATISHSPSPTPTTTDSQLISLAYLPDAQSVCILSRSGDISLIRLADFDLHQDLEYPVEHIGTVEPGITAASYSPDEELLVIVTLNDDLLLLTANGYFDVLAELPLRSSDFGQDKNVNVGWGSKSTQFHGRAGKQAATLPGGPSLVTSEQTEHTEHTLDSQPRVSWRGDSAFFAVSTLDLLDKESGDGQVEARVIRTYSRASAELQSTSEFAPGLLHPLAWRKGPGAPTMASVMRYGQSPGCAEGYEHLDIVFFERNGLRHGEFTLKGIVQGALEGKKDVRVKELEWSCDGVVLAVWLSIDNEDVVQLYSSANWYWYLKSEVPLRSAGNTNSVQALSFSDESPLNLSIILADSYRNLEWSWTVYSSPNDRHDLGLVGVVDGHHTKFTPLGIANVPPPMSLYQVQTNGTPVHVAFAHSSLAFLLPGGRVEVWRYEPANGHARPTHQSTHQTDAHARQIAWVDEHTLAVAGGELGVVDVSVDSKEGVYTRTSVHSEAVPLHRSLLVPGLSDTALLQDANARLHTLTLTPTPTLAELHVELGVFCPHVSYHGGTERVVALSPTGKLSMGSVDGVRMTPLATNALSYTLTPDFLIGTTSAHKAIFVDLHSASEAGGGVEERRVERGSRVVVACPRAMRLVLQMPRGNLETIAPRPLVLQNVRRDVEAGRYGDAFVACRKHRVDMNILFDLQPSLFFDRLAAFVDQIKHQDHLNLFLTALRDEDLTLTQYAKQEQEQEKGEVDVGDKSTHAPHRPNKVNEICTAVRGELLKRDLVAYTQTIMTSYVRMTPPNVEAALNLLHELQKQKVRREVEMEVELGDNSGDSVHDNSDLTDLVEEGVKYIIFLVDSRTLFDCALGMYDFELVLMVAQHSQRDPKEYLPFLRHLQGMGEAEQRFHIDDHLGRHVRALGHVYALYRSMSDTDNEKEKEAALSTFITYAQDHSLYKEALSLSKEESTAHRVVLEVYGDHLTTQNEYRDAALAYRLADLREKALGAYDRAHAWQELFAMMMEYGSSSDELADVAYRIAEDLNQRRRFSEAGRVLCDYTDDTRAAADQYIKGGEYAEAVRVCVLKKHLNLINTFIKPSLINAHETAMDEAEEMDGQLTKQMERLGELRMAKKAQPEAFYMEEQLENNPALDNVDVASDATTAVTQFTRYTQRASTFASSAMTGASKKNSKKSKRKAAMKEASGKRGTVNEEVYIMASLKRLVERVEGVLKEAGGLLGYLLIYGYVEEHRTLKERLGDLEERIEEAVGETWRESADDTAIPNNIPDTERMVWERVSSELSRKYTQPRKNKLIINHLDRLFVTNDAATIVEELEVVHPAAKLIVMASHQQEQEVGDGSNLVLILAGELLKKAENLLIMGLHPSEIVQGYELARNKALESLSDLSNGNLALPPTKQSLATSIKTSLGSKQFGNEDFLADLVSDAVSTVMPKDFSQFNIDNVRVVKIMGGNLYESRVLRGMVFGRQPEGVARNATKAKVAVFTSGIDISQTETKGTVLLKNADEMMNFTRGEEQQIEKVLKEIADSGVKVVVAGSQVGDLALHYLNRLDIVVIKVLSKFELRRLCRVVGATPLARLGAPTAEEAGYVDVLETTEIGGDRVTVFRQDNDQLTRTSTIVLRGATANHLDDIERAIDDGVNIIKTLLTKDNRFIAGAGGSEMELSKIIEDFGDKTPGLNQHAIKKFAEALQIVPITLSDNAGLNSTEILAKLLSAHSTDKGRDFGIDIDAVSDEGIINTLQHGIKDSLASKWWSIKYAVESAIAVLRVDSIIMSKAAGLAPPQQQGHWDDD
ncbi:hypothetical protein E3P86_00144 [Wallemia ichthyophaga]|uniref:CCT-theta n=1 Tax=Wallemia ichthyophaga TaxID=245174 RepID=A0A4T0JJN2_WALIC|nr:hypothetical protein E3P86_00144 [Wallemia ichthyophaga]